MATRVGCGETFNKCSSANFPQSVPVKEFWKSVENSQSYRYPFGVPVFFGTRCIRLRFAARNEQRNTYSVSCSSKFQLLSALGREQAGLQVLMREFTRIGSAHHATKLHSLRLVVAYTSRGTIGCRINLQQIETVEFGSAIRAKAVALPSENLQVGRRLSVVNGVHKWKTSFKCHSWANWNFWGSIFTPGGNTYGGFSSNVEVMELYEFHRRITSHFRLTSIGWSHRSTYK